MEDEANFDGWENPDEIDFFGEESPTTTQKVLEEVTKDDDIEEVEDKEKEETKEKEDKEPEIDFFSGSEEEEEEKETKSTDKDKTVNKETKEKEVKVSPKTHVEYLKNKGILDYELEEGVELTDEKAEEILEDSFDESVDNRLQEIMSELPDVVKQMVKYSKDGGDINDLLSSIKEVNDTQISNDLDMDQESNQIKVIKHKLAKDGYDEDTIEAQIEFFKESGKLEKTSKGFFKNIVKENEETYQNKLKEQEKTKESQKENRRKYKTDLTSALKDSEDINGIKFSRKDKTDLPAYISDPTIKLENGATVSPLQRDIFNALKDKNKTLILAKILKSDFDFSDFTKEAKTNTTRDVKKGLENTETKTPSKSKGGSPNKRKALEDFFN